MITTTEFILFCCFIAGIGYGLYWKEEAKKWQHLFKLIISNEEARNEIVSNFEEFKRKVG